MNEVLGINPLPHRTPLFSCLDRGIRVRRIWCNAIYKICRTYTGRAMPEGELRQRVNKVELR